MVEKQIFLSPAGAVKTAGYEQPLRLGYAKNRGVYRLTVTTSGEWAGLTIRAFWHVPGGTDPPASLVEDGMVEVPALVTALPGSGCITFEGTDGNRTLTSGDLAYCVSANSGTEDGTMPEPGTPGMAGFPERAQQRPFRHGKTGTACTAGSAVGRQCRRCRRL